MTKPRNLIDYQSELARLHAAREALRSVRHFLLDEIGARMSEISKQIVELHENYPAPVDPGAGQQPTKGSETDRETERQT